MCYSLCTLKPHMPAVLLILVEYAIYACLNRILPVSLSSLSCASIWLHWTWQSCASVKHLWYLQEYHCG